MLRMKKSIKDKWIKALRSGKYKQTEDHLRNSSKHGSSFCCLGVLCDIYQKEKKKNYWTNNDEFLGAYYIPPVKVLDWLLIKLSRSEKEIYENKSLNPFKQLMKMNDIEKLSFNDIADYLEDNNTLYDS